jgi:DNA-binding FadR family transcriptional regulator
VPYGEHVALLEGLRNGNARAAERALSGHIVGARKRLLNYMDALHDSSEAGVGHRRTRTTGGRK